MADENNPYLSKVCDSIYCAVRRHQLEKSKNTIQTKLLYMRSGKIKVEVRKEKTSHSRPHIHISHTDNFDVSLSIDDLTVLAGDINSTLRKFIKDELEPHKKNLMHVWEALNDSEDSAVAVKLINDVSN